MILILQLKPMMRNLFFHCSFVIAFVYSWKLTLVFLAVIPVQVGPVAWVFSVSVCHNSGMIPIILTLQMVMYGLADVMVRTGDERRAKLYEKAATMAHETLTLVRTIIAFGTYRPELARCVLCLCGHAAAGADLCNSYTREIVATERNGYASGFRYALVQGLADTIACGRCLVFL
jgi:ABC-type multidrug transport system fused ATPase/permease subunit